MSLIIPEPINLNCLVCIQGRRSKNRVIIGEYHEIAIIILQLNILYIQKRTLESWSSLIYTHKNKSKFQLDPLNLYLLGNYTPLPLEQERSYGMYISLGFFLI